MNPTAPIPHTFYGAKGGQGTTVTAAATALVHAHAGRRTLLIDAAPHHDTYAVLGLAEPSDPTTIVTATSMLDVISAEADTPTPDGGGMYEVIVVDAGYGPGAGPSHRTLVIRACYLALRRALAMTVTPDDVVLVEEPGRALHRSDLEAVLATPIVASIPVDPAISRTIDAGLLTTHIPKAFTRAVRDARSAPI